MSNRTQIVVAALLVTVAAAFVASRLRNAPVDSTTASISSSAHGSCVGSASASIRARLLGVIMCPSSMRTSPSNRPITVS